MLTNNKYINVINFKNSKIKQDIKKICCENCYKISINNLIDMRCSSCNKLSKIDWHSRNRKDIK